MCSDFSFCANGWLKNQIIFFRLLSALPSYFVEELLQPFATVLNEGLLENAIVVAERQLALERFAGQLWHNYLKNWNLKHFSNWLNLAVTLQLIPEPFKVGVAATDA